MLIGNAIDGGTKWGITIHNTHYGLVQDNVVYDAGGAGIMTEDGSETANVIQNNFIVRAWGTGDERADGRQGNNDWGWEGSGIWLRGPDNIVRNNVVANANSFAVTFMMLGDYANVLNEPRNPESSVFFAIAHRELGGSPEEALQVLRTEPSTLPLKATFEGVMRGCWFHQGGYQDLEIWSLLRDEVEGG